MIHSMTFTRVKDEEQLMSQPLALFPQRHDGVPGGNSECALCENIGGAP